MHTAVVTAEPLALPTPDPAELEGLAALAEHAAAPDRTSAWPTSR